VDTRRKKQQEAAEEDKQSYAKNNEEEKEKDKTGYLAISAGWLGRMPPASRYQAHPRSLGAFWNVTGWHQSE
jgi:hypothetical protein